MSYQTFLPNYYGSLVRGQQNALLLDNLYFYVADGVNKDATANNAAKTISDEQKTLTDILYGGKMIPSNLIAMMRKVEWVANKKFAKYDSRDPYLNDKDFYCISSNNRVYKCLDNNKDGQSLVEPTTNVPGPFTLSDGYKWIYMYSLTETNLSQYAVEQYIPVIVDPAVTAAAVPGAISTISVTNQGNYRYTASGSIQTKISNTVFRISDSTEGQSGTYNNMGFFIESGSGAGDYSQIINFTANTSGKFIETKDRLNLTGVGSNYSIAPYVNITGNGLNGKARAIMSGSRVDRIEVLNGGQRYTMADIELQANNAHVVTPSTAVTNISPIKGHGGDIYQELYVDNVMFNVYLDNFTFEETYPVNEITFCKVGLVREVYNNTMTGLYTADSFKNTFTVRISPAVGSYQIGDTVRSITNPFLAGTIVYADNTKIIGTYNSALMRFDVGDHLVSNQGVQGLILDITQPDVRLLQSDIVCQVNTDTIRRDENSNEYMQILIQIK